MSLIDKLNKKIGLSGSSNKDDDQEYDDAVDDDYDDEPEEDNSRRTNIPPRSPLGGGNVVDFTSVASLREQQARQKQQQAEAAVQQAAKEAVAQQQPMNVVVIEPKSFDDSQQVSQCLMDKRPVVINFENTDTDIAHRIVDFISGAVYALDGDIRKISRNVFLCAPSNVKLSSGDDKIGGLGDMTWLTK